MSENTIEKRTQLYRDRSAGKAPSPASAYKGIPEQPGLLAHVAHLVSLHVASGLKIADLAAGSGALALRLADLGYRVEAADYVAENFRPRDRIPFKRLDLNTDFSQSYGEPFDAIVATEIIEHLENPRHFLRQAAKTLREGGKLIITTPNVDSPVSKALMLAFGHPAWFGDDDYEITGHITPISIRVLRQSATEAGFAINYLGTFRDPWEGLAGWPKMRWYARVVSFLDRMPRDLRGDVLIAVMKRDSQ